MFDPASRVTDVGRKQRFFPDAARQAIKVRDRECFHELCDLPAEYCQIDHIHEWSKGGTTDQTNGRPACGFHNRQRNQRPTAARHGTDEKADDPPSSAA